MRFLFQALLSAAVVVIVWRLITVRGARTQALRRLGMLLFAVFGVAAILAPNALTWVAQHVGIGRGADLILYFLVIAFLGFAMNSYLRFRDLESRYTKLARHVALTEAAERYPQLRAVSPGPDPLDGPGIAGPPAAPSTADIPPQPEYRHSNEVD